MFHAKKHKVFALFAALLVSVSCLLQPLTAQARQVNLAAWADAGDNIVDNYSTAIANAFFSASNSGTMAQKEISWWDFANLDLTYGVNQNVYGATKQISGDTAQSANAVIASRYISTLYGYHYISPVLSDQNKAEDSAANAPMVASSIGIAAYNLGTSVINLLQDGVSGLNIVNIFSLDDPTGSLKPSGFVGDAVKKVMADNQIDGNQLKTLMFAVFSLISLVAAIVIVTSLRKANQGYAISRSGKWLLRLFTMVVTIPMAIVFTALAVEISGNLKAGVTQSINSQTDGIIVDTLQFAGNTNLALGAINPNATLSSSMPTPADANYGFDIDDNAKRSAEQLAAVYTEFEPTEQNVKHLNETLRSINYSGYARGQKPNGAAAINGLLGHELADVNDYFNWISASKSDVAAYFSPDESYTVFAGKGRLWANGVTTPTKNVLSISTNFDSSDPNNAPKNKPAQDALTVSEDESHDRASGGKNDDGKDTTLIYIPSFHGKWTKWSHVAEDPVNESPVFWNRPETYIYGASAAKNTSTQAQNVNSFVFTGATTQTDNVNNSDMSIDPTTAKPVKSPTDDGAEWDGSDPKQAFVANQIARAGINAAAGIKTYGASNSLSTQSVTFLLQSHSKYGKLNYKSGNLSGTQSSASTNAGAGGMKFERYTVPYSSDAQRSAKLFSLQIAWLSAGISAAIGAITLLTGPFLGALFKAYKGFFQALFTGDIFGLFDYAINLGAVFLSFVMFHLATMLGIFVVGLCSSIMGFFESLNNAAIDVGKMGDGSPVEVIGDMAGGLVGIFVAVVLAVAIAALLYYPMTTLNVGGSQRRTGVVATVILLPFTIAEALCTKVASWRSQVYGQSVLSGVAGKAGIKKPSLGGALGLATGAAVGVVGGIGMTKAVGSAVKSGVDSAKGAREAGLGIGGAITNGLVGAAQSGKKDISNIGKGVKESLRNKPSLSNLGAIMGAKDPNDKGNKPSYDGKQQDFTEDYKTPDTDNYSDNYTDSQDADLTQSDVITEMPDEAKQVEQPENEETPKNPTHVDAAKQAIADRKMFYDHKNKELANLNVFERNPSKAERMAEIAAVGGLAMTKRHKLSPARLIYGDQKISDKTERRAVRKQVKQDRKQFKKTQRENFKKKYLAGTSLKYDQNVVDGLKAQEARKRAAEEAKARTARQKKES